ncbi:hypothetical protein ACLOJK_031299 [Asimina triloba]
MGSSIDDRHAQQICFCVRGVAPPLTKIVSTTLRMVDDKWLACILATAIDLDHQLKILQNFIKSFNSIMQPRDFMAKYSRYNREVTIEVIEEGVEIDANWKVAESIIGSTITIEREGVTSLCGHFTGEELLVLGTDQPTIPFTTTVGEGMDDLSL